MSNFMENNFLQKYFIMDYHLEHRVSLYRFRQGVVQFIQYTNPNTIIQELFCLYYLHSNFVHYSDYSSGHSPRLRSKIYSPRNFVTSSHVFFGGNRRIYARFAKLFQYFLTSLSFLGSSKYSNNAIAVTGKRKTLTNLKIH